VWAVVSKADPERIEGRPVPREVIEMFSAENDRRPADQKSRRKKQ
jgi:hypothetical protein